MSGLNPFRPRKPENPPIHHHSSSTSISANTTFLTPQSSTATSQNVSFEPNGLSGTPPTSHVPDLDDSMSSDDQSISDPFHQDAYMSEDDMERRRVTVSSTARGSSHPSLTSHDDYRSQASIHSIPPHTAPYQPAQSTGQARKDSNRERSIDRENYKSSRNTMSSSSIRSLTPHGRPNTAGNCATDVLQSTVRTDTSKHPATGEALPTFNTDAKPLASRSVNKEKVPPPPPKSHHGKLINSGAGSSPSPQPTPPKHANCLSFHSYSPDSSSPPGPSQVEKDYFTGSADSELEKPSEPLRRSQSQYKRPPTPPLSRRHSQMRRSKTTLSKPNPSRLSMPAVKMEGTESPPPSPSSWTLNPSRARDAELSASSGETPRRPSLQHQNSGAAISTLGTEVSTPSSRSNSRTPTKRSSIGNPLPPPPPPRRTRGSSSQSNDSTRPSLQSEKQPEVPKEYIPHPSNASGILADLSRLQKEVDDLRVHYESRKASH
ncbi:hypothetical protein BDV23DRAFT_145753 [Aspergillus alliaceus]|uniref:Uncharacterized protein n=1 Tax=Petromyces alliaceus TaxID=209559 RepID=A0A5N7CM75_PETAA|nr:hypothetical protein BDV23DRAFT_145753 [Aspergillus alliaceus]